MDRSPVPTSHDKLLFTPGPLTTSATVKQAQLRDFGSRDAAFIALVRDVRDRLTALATARPGAYTAVPVQGSGTFGLEAVVGSAIPPAGRLLVAVNGAYGRRIAHIARTLGIDTAVLEYGEDEPVCPEDVAARLEEDGAVSAVAVCHCETTSGILNPVLAIGETVHRFARMHIVDAMSSFGAVPVSMDDAHIDFLVSSANKCIEGVPGFSFVLTRVDALLGTRGWARSVALDLLAQYEGLEANGQFRFTPPTHALAAFHQALLELDAEGGVAGRLARYQANHDTLMAGMTRLGFEPYLRPELRSPIITSFRYPDHPAFDFQTFYEGLSALGYVTYPGKVGDAACFRIGTIGRLFPADFENLLGAIAHVLDAMGVEMPQPAEEPC